MNKPSNHLLGLDEVLKSWVGSAQLNKRTSEKKKGQAFLFFKREVSQIKKILSNELEPYQCQLVLDSKATFHTFITQEQPIFVVKPYVLDKDKRSSAFNAELSYYGQLRDLMGGLYQLVKSQKLEALDLMISAFSQKEEIEAILVGLEMARYQYKQITKIEAKSLPQLSFHFINKKVKASDLEIGHAIGVATNLARHLVNLPPNLLNPLTYSQALKIIFGVKSAHHQLVIWDEKKLAQEGMNLHLAVGTGSLTPPRMVHLKYRPPGCKNKKPMAFVGKGVTFDSGGLDIKPSAGMRFMKKDMGGSAALVGLAYFVLQTKYQQPMDFYWPMAENSVDEKSYRPSDVFVSRNGKSVEIHNTDAEGRLLLVDSMDLAVKQKGKDSPQFIIDVATLTGAIKVGLGNDIGGLFANDQRLAQKIEKAAFRSGDRMWRMPIFQDYRSSLNSGVADLVNSSNGNGGAITAALFLEEFVDGRPWAHLDIYAWTDSSRGALCESGGSGQGVQCLVDFVRNY